MNEWDQGVIVVIAEGVPHYKEQPLNLANEIAAMYMPKLSHLLIFQKLAICIFMLNLWFASVGTYIRNLKHTVQVNLLLLEYLNNVFWLGLWT